MRMMAMNKVQEKEFKTILVEKPLVLQCVADWYEEHKYDIDFSIFCLLTEWNTQDKSLEFIQWFGSESNPIRTLIDMCRVGYEVEKND